MPNPVEGRVIVEMTRTHALVYRTDSLGVVIDTEVFKWPYRLDKKDAVEELRGVWDWMYDYLNNNVNFDADDHSARGGG